MLSASISPVWSGIVVLLLRNKQFRQSRTISLPGWYTKGFVLYLSPSLSKSTHNMMLQLCQKYLSCSAFGNKEHCRQRSVSAGGKDLAAGYKKSSVGSAQSSEIGYVTKDHLVNETRFLQARAEKAVGLINPFGSSVWALANESGGFVEKYAYDLCSRVFQTRKRSAAGLASNCNPDEFSEIGNPYLATFLSPNPVLDTPDPQATNRYSYCVDSCSLSAARTAAA